MRTKVFGSLCPQAAWLFTAIISLLIPSASLLAQASLFDPAFAIGSGANGSVNSIIVQNDGKILVGGDFTQIAGQTNLYLARLNPDGQVDQTFAGVTDGTVYRLLKQADGKILVAGAFTNIQGVLRQGVGRLLTNGVVDETFDAGTFFETINFPFSLGLQSDGKILVGTYQSGSHGRLFRINIIGQVDNSFIQTNYFSNYHIFTITPRTNGSILLGGGFQGVNNFSTPGLALLCTNGQLDTNFISPLKTDSYSGAYAIVEQPDNSLVIGGHFWREGVTNELLLAKLTSGLTWDTNFQPDVFAPNSINPPYPTSYVLSALAQPDGKIVLGGFFQEVGGYWRKNIVRVDSQGHVDPCFDPGIGLLASSQGVIAIAQQSDGKILAVGNFTHSVDGNFAGSLASSNIVRLLPQGECNATRVHLGKTGVGKDYVLGTCAPGGVNHLQWSTNLLDWATIVTTTLPYVYFDQWNISDVKSGVFFRVKKEY